MNDFRCTEAGPQVKHMKSEFHWVGGSSSRRTASRAFRAVKLEGCTCLWCGGSECFAETRPYVPGFVGLAADIDTDFSSELADELKATLTLCLTGEAEEPRPAMDSVGLTETMCTWCGNRWVTSAQDEANLTLLRAAFIYARRRASERERMREQALATLREIVAEASGRAAARRPDTT